MSRALQEANVLINAVTGEVGNGTADVRSPDVPTIERDYFDASIRQAITTMRQSESATAN